MFSSFSDKQPGQGHLPVTPRPGSLHTWYLTGRLAVVIVAIVRVAESGGSAGPPTESTSSPSESASALPPALFYS